MKRHLSNTIYGLKFAMDKNDFKRLKSSSEKKRNDFVANPIVAQCACKGAIPKWFHEFFHRISRNRRCNCNVIM